MEGHALDISAFLGALLLLLVVAKIGAEIAERLGQPSVLGEIVAGVLVGATGLGLLVRGLDASGAAVFQMFGLRGGVAASTYGAPDALAEIGAIVLLFEIGCTPIYTNCAKWVRRRCGSGSRAWSCPLSAVGGSRNTCSVCLLSPRW